MADGNQEATGGSWWGSWINSAKAKTSTVLEAVKKDLDELSTAVRTEASNVGAALNSTLQFDEETSPVGTVKKSISTFFGQVTEALVPSLEDDEVEAVLITRDGAVTLTGFPKHLADLQQNDKTFTDEPLEELAGKYKRWMEVIEQDQFTQNQLNKHLASSEILNEKYISLVPTKVPHMEFWKRYLFKRALLQDAIANATLIEKRAKAEVESVQTISPRKALIQTEQPKLACTENEISTDAPAEVVVADEASDDTLEKELLNEEIYWGSEEMPSNIELSEEEQTRLLEEYEQEIQEREKRKSLVLNEEVSSQIIASEAEIAVEKPENPQPSKKAGQVANKKQTPETKKNSKSNANSKQPPKKSNSDKQQQPAPKKQPQKDKPAEAEEKGKTVLSVQKDHFNKEENSSSTSDESWEKDFDLDE